MNVILVDTPQKTITSVSVGDRLTLLTAYSLIGCTSIEVHRIPNLEGSHLFYCDEEAKLKDPLPPAFVLKGFYSVLFGRIIIFRTKGDIEISPTASVEDIAERIIFGS